MRVLSPEALLHHRQRRRRPLCSPAAAASPPPPPSTRRRRAPAWVPPWPASRNDDVLDGLARASLSAALAAPPGRRLVIGLAGCPGSGKSTTAAEVVARCNALAGTTRFAVVLPMDGFHLSRAQLDGLPNPEEAHARRGAPWTFDAASFVSAVRDVATLAGRWPVFCPSFDHAAGDPVPNGVVVRPHHRLVIVEGLYLLLDEPPWSELRPLFNDVWFMDVAPARAGARLAARHCSVWGVSKEDAAARVKASDSLNAELVWPSRARARLLVPSYDT